MMLRCVTELCRIPFCAHSSAYPAYPHVACVMRWNRWNALFWLRGVSVRKSDFFLIGSGGYVSELYACA